MQRESQNCGVARPRVRTGQSMGAHPAVLSEHAAIPVLNDGRYLHVVQLPDVEVPADLHPQTANFSQSPLSKPPSANR